MDKDALFANIYVRLIHENLKSIEDVPEHLKTKVQELLGVEDDQ